MRWKHRYTHNKLILELPSNLSYSNTAQEAVKLRSRRETKYETKHCFVSAFETKMMLLEYSYAAKWNKKQFLFVFNV